MPPGLCGLWGEFGGSVRIARIIPDESVWRRDGDKRASSSRDTEEVLIGGGASMADKDERRTRNPRSARGEVDIEMLVRRELQWPWCRCSHSYASSECMGRKIAPP